MVLLEMMGNDECAISRAVMITVQFLIRLLKCSCGSIMIKQMQRCAPTLVIHFLV